MRTYGGVSGYKMNSISEAVVAHKPAVKYSYGRILVACLVYMLKITPLILGIILALGGVIIAFSGN